MIRNVALTLVWVFVGLLVGEIPVGKTSVGEMAWKNTRSALTWSGGQMQSLVSYAGFGDSGVVKWLEKMRTSPKAATSQTPAIPTPIANKPATQPSTQLVDEEGLTPQDKEALRQILE